jgi:hypothetical protein
VKCCLKELNNRFELTKEGMEEVEDRSKEVEDRSMGIL